MLQTSRMPTMEPSAGQTRPGEFGDESSTSGAEGRARKRFQRPNTGNDDPLRKQPTVALPFPSRFNNAASATEVRVQNHARRRSTLRDNNRPLLGPRPFESKRVISESHAPAVRPSFLPQSTSDSQIAQSTIGVNPRYSFSRTREGTKSRESSGSQDFLPSVNFDDFHASLNTVDQPDLDTFPIPGGLLSRQDTLSKSLADGKSFATTSTMDRGLGRGTQDTSASRVARSSSLARRVSNARHVAVNHANTDSTSMPPPSAPIAGRGRRQSSATSTDQAANTKPTARQPRKSFGPGLFTQGLEERRAGREAQQVATSPMTRTASIKASKPPAPGQGPSSGPDLARLAMPRNPRTKSLQPTPPSQPQNNLHPQPTTPVNGTPTSSNALSPGWINAQSTGTPSSTSKRQSTLHVGGLGARTISPTDARRYKRMSTVGKLPGPQAPPTPQSDTLPGLHPHAQVPLLHQRNTSATPSSSRGTPDLSRKSMPTLSTSASYSSLRAPNGGASSRSSQIIAGSRIPTPKPRNVHSSAGFQEVEEVPPVPAIPKAYESPKDIMPPDQQSYFPSRKSQKLETDEFKSSVSSLQTASRAQAGSNLSGRPSIDSPAERTSFTQDRTGMQATNVRHKRGLTVGSGDSTNKPHTQNANLNKKNLQPLRLPPLNLLPLSTPTATRIANYPAPSLELDERHATPPPKRTAKTPSTPMTASKATFFSRKDQDAEEEYRAFNLRSASSAHMPSSDMYGSRPYDPSPTTPVAIPSPHLRQPAHTPFASTSLPKPSGEFTQLERPVELDVYNQFDGTGSNAVLPSPKPQLLTKRDVPSTRTSTSEEPSTPASASSNLRRKLSMSWKRSSSKASQRAKAEAEKERIEKEKEEAKRASRQAQADMPPPRLPASASWNGNFSPTVTDSSSRPSLESRFRKASATSVNREPGASEAELAVFSARAEPTDVVPPNNDHRRLTSRSTPSSVLTPMQRILGTKSSMSALRARHLDTNLDKDDLAADKIMEKMGSKRKDFDHQAKELDELRRRSAIRDRFSPQQATQTWDLNIFERGEIIDYKEVFFHGTKNARKHVGDLNHATNNFGYDDERGDYNIVMGDHLAYRYEVVDMLGKGSFGQVVRCIDYKTGMLVAVKIIRNKKRFHQQALVEVNILQKLREWDPDNKHSMINFTQSFYFRGHLCIATELLGMNLYEFIKAYEFKGFPLPLIRRFTKQMLNSLRLLKTKRVIHCDLKPENILLAHPMHSEIKVIDFGSSCFEHEKVYTYIQSRFYRSPEVILGMSYGIPIDMWSLGCILAELLTGYPIFPGENEQEQLACIMEIFGPPEKHLIEKSSRKKLFFDSMGKPRVTVSSKGRRRRPSSKTLQQALKCDDETFLDFIQRCLRWDPDRRLKPDEALQHEFVTGIKRTVPARTRVGHGAPSVTQSPVKRLNTVPTPRNRVESSSTRPLPEPPAAASYRNPSALPAPSASPVKGGPGRRHSTLPSAPTLPSSVAPSMKRTVTGGAIPLPSSSGLPRVAPTNLTRSISSKPDMASAAAAASLQLQRPR